MSSSWKKPPTYSPSLSTQIDRERASVSVELTFLRKYKQDRKEEKRGLET